MMIGTEKFINEIRLRECIWNPHVTEYSSKISRKRAWKEIGRALNPEWSTTFTAEDRYKTTTEYIKKWKNIKDYYYRCRHKATRGKKKTPGYFNDLVFLDAIKSPKDTPNNVANTVYSDDSEDPLITDEINTYETDNNTSDFESSIIAAQIKDEFDENSIQHTFKSNVPQNGLMKQITATQNNSRVGDHDHDQEHNAYSSSNKHFLLSLLANMDGMTEEQNLSFRLSVLNTVRNIKYNKK